MPKISSSPRRTAHRGNNLFELEKAQSIDKKENFSNENNMEQFLNHDISGLLDSCENDMLNAVGGQIDIASSEPESVNTMEGTSARAQNRGKPSACVFVASLPAQMSDDELCRLVAQNFKKFGEISSVKVLRDPENRPYAFVQYTNDTDCQNAIIEGHNFELGGRRLRCEAAKVNRTLFFSFLVAKTKENVIELVSTFGGTDLVLPGSESGRLVHANLSLLLSRNWFVKFSYRDEAIQAFATLSESQEFQVEWAQNVDDISPPQSMFDRNSVYVGHLSPNVTADKLKNHFKAHGSIENISIIRRRDATFAFITFEDEFAAASAIARDNHSLFMNMTIHVKYKMASGKKPMRMLLSPRVPVALAPPPILQRSRYTGSVKDWSARTKPRIHGDQMPIPRKLENTSYISSTKPSPAARYYIIPN